MRISGANLSIELRVFGVYFPQFQGLLLISIVLLSERRKHTCAHRCRTPAASDDVLKPRE